MLTTVVGESGHTGTVFGVQFAGRKECKVVQVVLLSFRCGSRRTDGRAGQMPKTSAIDVEVPYLKDLGVL